MIPPLNIATRLHSLYIHGAESFHRQVAPPDTPCVRSVRPPPEQQPLVTTAFAAAVAPDLDTSLQGLFDRLDADPAVQQGLRDHQGPDGFDLPGFLRSGTAGAIGFAASFGLRSAVAGSFPRNPWVQSLSWFLAAAATAPLSNASRQLTGASPAVEPAGWVTDTLPSAVFLGVNLLHLYGRHTRYPGGTLAGIAQALGLSALTGFSVVAARAAVGGEGPPRAPQPVGEAMLQRALLVSPVAAMSLYVFSRSQRGLPLRALDRLGPLLLLSVVWCLRNERLLDGGRLGGVGGSSG